MTLDLTPYNAQASSLLDILRREELHTDADFEAAGEMVKQVKAKLAELKTARDSITKPLRESIRATTDLFSDTETRFEEAERLLKTKIASYLAARTQTHHHALQTAADANDTASVIALAAKSAPVVDGISTRVLIDFEVVDETSVPAEYKTTTLNLSKIRADIRAAKGKIEIPGIRVVERMSVAVSTHKDAP